MGKRVKERGKERWLESVGIKGGAASEELLRRRILSEPQAYTTF